MRAARVGVGVGFVLACFACEGGQKTVGSEGGTIFDSSEEASVVIPAGALSESTLIKVEEAEPPVALPANYPAQGAIYRFTPHGQLFERPATITLPHSAGSLDNLAVLRLDGDLDTSWEAVDGVEFGAETATFDTSAFSYYAVGQFQKPGLDILFVIDNSSTMGVKQGRLASSFPILEDLLRGKGSELPDLHIGVVTTDLGAGPFDGSGCAMNGDSGASQMAAECELSVDRYLRDVKDDSGGRTRNYAGTLAETLGCMARVGTDGCGFEQPMESMR